jgi:heptosyltransferase-3
MLLAGCFLQNLKNRYPHSKITVIGREMSRQAASLLTGLDSFAACNAPWLTRRDSMGWGAFISFCMRNLKRYDIAFDLHGDPRNNILACMLGKKSAGFGFRGFGFLLSVQACRDRPFTSHIIGMQCALLTACGIAADTNKTGISIISEAVDEAKGLLLKRGIPHGTFILIQSTSGRNIKDWPIAHWKKLVKSLAQESIIVTADKNAENVAAMKGAAPPGRFFDFSVDLAVYAALVGLCARVVSIDTFTVHLAKALGRPITAVYSGTNLTGEWGPFMPGPKDAVFQDTSCPLFPCAIMHECPYGKPSPCMERITPEMVIERRIA